MSKRVVSTAAALLIGNELLSGKIRDENLFDLARTLRSIGVRLERVLMVEDDREIIAREVRQLSDAFDVVFTSGGVGPTHDDLTLESVADAFGVKALFDDQLEALLRRSYGDRFREGHRRMALVPEGAELVATGEVPWPTVVMRNVWVLPGVPQVFRMKLLAVRERLQGSHTFISRSVFTRMDEGHLKPLLDEIVAAHPEVDVGSYPRWGHPDYRTKLTFDGATQASVDAALDAFVALLPDGEPQSVE